MFRNVRDYCKEHQLELIASGIYLTGFIAGAALYYVYWCYKQIQIALDRIFRGHGM